jgi:hypothetical protein
MRFPALAILVLLVFPAPARPAPTRAGCPECERVAALVDTLPGAFAEVMRGTFHEDITDHDRAGCMLILSGSWEQLGERHPPDVLIFDTLTSEGWRPGITSSDGPDGTSYALVKGDVICLVRGRWDGGDDMDTTYVTSDVYQIVVICAPLLADDRRRLKEDAARERGQ